MTNILATEFSEFNENFLENSIEYLNIIWYNKSIQSVFPDNKGVEKEKN